MELVQKYVAVLVEINIPKLLWDSKLVSRDLQVPLSPYAARYEKSE